MKTVDNQAQSTIEAPKPSKREAFLEKMRARRPDVNFDDDDSVFDAIDGEMSDRDEKIKTYEDDNEKISNLFTKDKRSAEFFRSWLNGNSPMATLIEMFGDDFRGALESEEGRKQFDEAYGKYLDRMAQSKELDAQAADNMQKTFEMFDRMQQEKGWDDDIVTKIAEKLDDILQKGIMNIVDEETVEMIAKALSYDADVAEAESIGETRGRNAKITEKLRKKEEPQGIPPTLGGDNDSGIKPKRGRRAPFAFAPGGIYED